MKDACILFTRRYVALHAFLACACWLVAAMTVYGLGGLMWSYKLLSPIWIGTYVLALCLPLITAVLFVSAFSKGREQFYHAVADLVLCILHWWSYLPAVIQ
jgi:uncharacterized membrane protein